ncbi:spore cortex biosynthesis protein YabQ [uncultured Clostridium sp.]|nr:spore cortex biosynthesis protein YabQ [uncultured Clostridium sp.]
MLPFTQDVSAFYATIYGGIAVGILFDIYRSLRHNFKIVRTLSLFFDTLFWLIVTMLTFITINAVENFDLRYYHIVALFIGFFIYYGTISKFILTGLNKVIYFITNLIKKTVHYIVDILSNLYYVIIYSVHLLFDIIFYIPNMFLATRKFVKRKSVGILKKKKRV